MAEDYQIETIETISRECAKLLAGHPPEEQGAALANLLAIWLAGHRVSGDAKATRHLRRELMKFHIKMVSKLVAVETKKPA